ncbi:MAG: hypothetical protein ACR2FY_24890 [Pirellulaceae bacterium]
MSSSNPFATRFTRPGAIGYLFPPGQSAVGTLDLLRNNDWWGEIVGPHGSGKSSLLAELLPLLEATGRRVVLYGLHQGDRTLPISKSDVAAWNAETQVVIDGYEQLSWWSKRRLQSWVKARQAGLLITAHQPMGLPPLFGTQPTLALAREIVAQLLKSDQVQSLTGDDIAAAFAAHGANLREMLFSLYDVYQQRQADAREG